MFTDLFTTSAQVFIKADHRSSNSALYVSSRTLFFLAQKSDIKMVKNTLGRTNNGQTPLAAILVSFLPGGLAFLIVGADKVAFQEVRHPVHSDSRVLILSSQFLSSGVFTPVRSFAFMQASASRSFGFERGEQVPYVLWHVTDYTCRMKMFPNTIDRDSKGYKARHYRAHWQPAWAIIGLTLCTLLLVTLGWGAVYDLCAKTEGVTKRDSIVDLATAYLGVSYFSMKQMSVDR